MITYLNVKWNIMLIYNCLQALNKVNNRMKLFKVKSPMKVPSTSHSGQGKSLTLNGYSSG